MRLRSEDPNPTAIAIGDRLQPGLSAQTVLVLTSVLVLAAASIYRLSADPNVTTAGAMPAATASETVSTLTLSSVADAVVLDSDGGTPSVAAAQAADPANSTAAAGSIQPGSREPSSNDRSTGSPADADEGADPGEPDPSQGRTDRIDRISATGPATTATTADGSASATSSYLSTRSTSTAPSLPPTTAVTATTTVAMAASDDPTTTRMPSTTVVVTSQSTVYEGPTAQDDVASAEAGKDLKIHVLRNDSAGADDIDKDTLVIISGPGHADSYRVHGDHLHYRSEDTFAGVDRLRYQVCDEAGRCDQASVAITVG